MPDPSPSTPPWAQSPSEVALDVFIADHGPLESGGPSWAIRSDDEAEWAMAHLAAAQATLAAIRDQYELWLNQLAEWLVAASREHKRTVEFFDVHLRQYALARRQANPNAKTLALPSGKVPTQDRSPQVVVVDDDALVAWAESTVYVDPFHPPHSELGEPAPSATFAALGVVKVTKEARVSVLRKLVTIVEAACEHCDGEGSVVLYENDDGQEPIGSCGYCDGRGKTFTVVTLLGELVPGVAVEPGGIAVSAPAPVLAVKL